MVMTFERICLKKKLKYKNDEYEYSSKIQGWAREISMNIQAYTCILFSGEIIYN